MVAHNCWRSVGPRGACTLVGPPHDRLHMVSSWVGLGLVYIGAWPRIVSCLGLCLVLLRFSALRFSGLRLLLCFPLVFKCVPCKTCFFQYKWNYVKSKCICVKSLFISPVLDSNWQSNIIVKDHQQLSRSGSVAGC